VLALLLFVPPSTTPHALSTSLAASVWPLTVVVPSLTPTSVGVVLFVPEYSYKLGNLGGTSSVGSNGQKESSRLKKTSDASADVPTTCSSE